MAAQWKIVTLESINDADGNPKFIETIHWEATDRNGEHIGRSYGSVTLPEDHESRETPWANLNENACIGYVKDALGDEVGEIESAVATQIAERMKPSKSLGMPWAS